MSVWFGDRNVAFAKANVAGLARDLKEKKVSGKILLVE